jgi:N-formylglutamate deformylase
MISSLEMKAFKITMPASSVPILISVPHCGIHFPDELKEQYKQELIVAPDDTDWFVDTLYDFAGDMGMPMLTATYSRWVVDLNRDPESKPLYTDGRIITALCPATTFLGESLYKDDRKEVTEEEQKRRVTNYYKPYHDQLNAALTELKNLFGTVLLWDCHSIRQLVPTIRAEKFPDLILGDANETSASKEIIDIAFRNLSSGGYSINHNSPFKGGFITRNYGRPSENQHALQLEMTKVNYMDNTEMKYDKQRANKMRELLRRNFENLITYLTAQ